LGNSGDEVVTTGFNDLVTNKTVNGVAYNVYTYGDTNAELWIQERVTLRKMQCGFKFKGVSTTTTINTGTVTCASFF
jgi:hypothetical protein